MVDDAGEALIVFRATRGHWPEGVEQLAAQIKVESAAQGAERGRRRGCGGRPAVAAASDLLGFRGFGGESEVIDERSEGQASPAMRALRDASVA